MTSTCKKIHHMALLVPSVKKAAAVLERFGFFIGPAEEWEGEGTLEIYVGDRKNQSSLLLLMEPLKEGAYTRALQKRGPGLHHLAIEVLDLEHFIDGVSGSGWYLHPKSLQTIQKTQTAYLARPGMPMLIEVQQLNPVLNSARKEVESESCLIQQIEMPLLERDLEMLKALGISQVIPSQSEDAWIHFEGIRLDFKELY